MPELPFSPAADRNKEAILQVLLRNLAARARVLEVASGTGQHAEHFAAAQAGWTWQPTEGDAALLPGIAERCRGLANVLAPLRLDVVQVDEEATPAASFDALYCANLLHISPWPVCAALMRCARRHLVASGALVIYGPFIADHRPTARSNVAFDADLRMRDARWGLRRLADVQTEAARCGFVLRDRLDMPANNLTLVFDRSPH